FPSRTNTSKMRESCSPVRRTWIMSISLAHAVGARDAEGATGPLPPPISLLELHAANHESNSACLVVSVVTVVVVTGPDPLPAPRGRLPTPTRAAIETNADAKWHRREGKAAIVERIDPGERKPIDAWCKSRPERKAACPDETTAESGTAEPSAHHSTAESGAAKTSAHHSAAESGAAETSAHHSAAKAATYRRTVKAPAAEASAPAHPGIGCG